MAKAEISKDLLALILEYFLCGEWSEDTGGGRGVMVDDCTAARLYDSMKEEFPRSKLEREFPEIAQRVED